MVVVLSRAFLRKKHPMEELRCVMERRRQDDQAGTRSQHVCAVLHDVSFEDCSAARFPPVPDEGSDSDIAAEGAEAYRQAIKDLVQRRSCLREDKVSASEPADPFASGTLQVDCNTSSSLLEMLLLGWACLLHP